MINPLINKVKINKIEIILGLGVIAGIGIIFTIHQLYWKGILLAIISAFLGALFTVLNKNISSKIEPATITFYELFFGFLLLTIALPLWFGINNSSYALPTEKDWIYLIILAVVCTTVPFTLSMHAIKKLDAFTMNLSLNLEPVYSIILAIILFHENETVGYSFYIGTGIILLTVMWHAYTKSVAAIDKKLEKEKYNYE